MTTACELRAVSRVYPGASPVDALREIDLQIPRGEMTAILGPSGCGKSTLLGILGLLDAPTSGHMLVGGRDVTSYSDRKRTVLRAETLGFVFQQFFLVGHLTVLGNVETALLYRGLRRADRAEAAAAALRTVAMDHRLGHHPRQLSGGEQQRVAIARAIVHNPPIVLADEPTGNLDSENAASVIAQLRSLVSPETAVVVVTHDAGVAAAADRRIHMFDGRITSESRGRR